ncbi:hypothetical protein SVAN01_03815 [Stagonosporopsis vannaccii]|nr:hypothetical protein SVAN01_03815 [Stagonosporopsis vannaccii]
MGRWGPIKWRRSLDCCVLGGVVSSLFSRLRKTASYRSMQGRWSEAQVLFVVPDMLPCHVCGRSVRAMTRFDERPVGG